MRQCEMVWAITGAESYVCETGKSMKAMELAVSRKDGRRNIAVTLQLKLLRRERAARRNDGDHVLAIEIRPHDRAIIPLGITHIGPVDVPSGDIEHQAIGQLPAFVDDGLQIGAIRVCGQYAAAAEVQEEEPGGRRCVFRLCVYRCGTYRAHVTNLLANVSMWSRQSAKPRTCAHRSPSPIWNRFPRRPIHTSQFLDPIQRRLRACSAPNNLSTARMKADSSFSVRMRQPLASVIQRSVSASINIFRFSSMTILEGHLGCMKSTHSMNAATWGR